MKIKVKSVLIHNRPKDGTNPMVLVRLTRPCSQKNGKKLARMLQKIPGCCGAASGRSVALFAKDEMAAYIIVTKALEEVYGGTDDD